MNAQRESLSLPDVFEASNIPKGSQVPSGIISKIRSEVSDIMSYVYPSKNGTCYGDVNTLVNWNIRAKTGGKNRYLQIEFKKGFAYPTSYSIKGYNGNYFFPKGMDSLWF